MNKTIIIYYSKTGFSQRYAQWLAEDLRCHTVPYRDRKSINLAEYRTIILLGGLYAGNMSGLSWLKKQPTDGQRVAAVAVGCAPMDHPNLPESMEKLFGRTPQIRGFYCQGGLAYERMSAINRAMMAALQAALRSKPEMADMLAGISQSFDGTNRAFLKPVIAWARQ